MAGGTEEQEQAAVDDAFPYLPLMAHPAWSVLDNAFAAVESNGDLELQTPRRYLVGYLLHQLVEANLLPPVLPAGLTTEQQKNLVWRLVYEVPVSKKGRKVAV